MMQKTISNRAITKTDLKKEKTIKANPAAISEERQKEMRRTSPHGTLWSRRHALARVVPQTVLPGMSFLFLGARLLSFS